MVRSASWELKFRVSGLHGLRETYPALRAAGARSRKYFLLAALVEAESAMELRGSKELDLKGNGRPGQDTDRGDPQDEWSPATFPTLVSYHGR